MAEKGKGRGVVGEEEECVITGNRYRLQVN